MKETFVLRTEWYSSIEGLSIQDKSEILDAVFLYHMDREDEIQFSSPLGNMCWSFIKPTIDYHTRRYNTSVENGKKGGAPKGNSNAKKQPKTTQEQPKSTKEQPKNNLTVTDTVIVTDIVIDNDIDTGTGNVIENINEDDIKQIMINNTLSREEAIEYILQLEKKPIDEVTSKTNIDLFFEF
jgi:predicted component of type VI protein secretion system